MMTEHEASKAPPIAVWRDGYVRGLLNGMLLGAGLMAILIGIVLQ